MVLYNGLCRSLNKKVDFNVEDVISMNTTRGIKWRVKGNYEGHNISTFCSEIVAKELLSKLPLTMDAEIAYTPPSEIYHSEELIPSFSNATKNGSNGQEANMAEEKPIEVHEQIQENTNAHKLDLHSEKLPSKYYKKNGSLDMRYTICKEFAAKQAESQNAVELEAPYTPIKPERPSDDSGGRDKNRRKPRRPLGAEGEGQPYCHKCNTKTNTPVIGYKGRVGRSTLIESFCDEECKYYAGYGDTCCSRTKCKCGEPIGRDEYKTESFEAEIQGCCLCGDSTDLVGCENRKCDELICKACIIDPSEEVLCPSCAYSAESFEADDTKYADIEKLLESDEDVFLGGDDWNQYPEHPQKERIIEYLTQRGGGQTPYRICFTCSKVTDDWLLINEGYECMPCSEINRTDYEKRKWGSEDSLKYSYGGFQSEEVSQEANEVVYAEGVPALQDAEAGIEIEDIENEYIKKENQFMSLLVDDATLYRIMTELPNIVEIESSELAGYTTLRFNYVENPDMEQKILEYAIILDDTKEDTNQEPEYRAGDVRNRLFNVEFDDWAEQEMLTHGGDVSFKEWADEESDSHGDDGLLDWAKHEDESHDERYDAEDFTISDSDRYELGDEIIALSSALKRTGNWDWKNLKKIGKAIKQGDFNRVKGHMDDIDIKTRRVLWDNHHEGLLELFSNSQLHALTIPWIIDGYGAEGKGESFNAEIGKNKLKKMINKFHNTIDSFTKGLEYRNCVSCGSQVKLDALEDNEGNTIYHFYSCECGHNDIQDSSYDAESFENYQLLAEEAGGVFLIENNKGFNIEFENGYQVSVKFGAGHYSDNYEKNPIIEMGRYLESSTAEIAILRNGLLIPLDEEGHKKVKGWVPTSIIPPLLTAASEGDEEKIKSIIKEYEKSQQGAESFGAEDTKGYYERYALCEWCSDEIQKESDAVSMRGEIICKGCKEAWGEQPVDGGFGAESKVELKRDSCCCGATIENPCLCMKEGVMNCSSVEPKCPCYSAKDAESFSAEVEESDKFIGKIPTKATMGEKTRIHKNNIKYIFEKVKRPLYPREVMRLYDDERGLTSAYPKSGRKLSYKKGGISSRQISRIVKSPSSKYYISRSGLIHYIGEDSMKDYIRNLDPKYFAEGITNNKNKITLSDDMILNYLVDSHNWITKYTAPYKYTSWGLAQKFGVHPSNMRALLRKLVSEGKLKVTKRHCEDRPDITTKKTKLNIYYLADKRITNK